jgi:ferrochelatase
LVKNSLEQARLLEERLGIKTFCGMLYSEPLLEKVARELLSYSPEVVYHITLYPQFSYSTVAPCERDANRFLKGIKLLTVRSWCRNGNYLEWIRSSLAPYLRGKDPSRTALLFSAHSVPKYFVEKFKDPYPKEVAETVRRAVEPFKEFKVFLGYQSKVGPIEWLEPSTEEVLKKIKSLGFEEVVLFPVSFVSEHVETLYELDREYGHLAKELGLKFERVKLDHTSRLLVEAMAEEIEKLRGEL